MFFFLPYRIERTARRFPWITATLIALNLIVFAATWLDIERAAYAFGFIWGPRAVFTWFTSMFLHTDPFHIGFNMFFLWLFGSFVEDALGSVKYLGLYVAGGLAASVIDGLFGVLVTPQYAGVPSVGASGALAAIMGLFMVRFYKHKVRIAYFVMIWLYPKWGVWRPTGLVAIGLWFLGELWSGLWLATGTFTGVANWAHIGGLVFGAAAGLMIGAKFDADTEYLADEATEWSISGSHDIAAAKYEQLVERTPDDPEALLGEAKALFGSRDGDIGRGVEDLRRAVELLVSRGDQHRVLLAWEELRGLAAGKPIDAKTLVTAASIAESHARPDLASEAYWRVVAEHAGTREAERALFRLAHVYLAAGMHAEARDCWGRFCTAHPHSEWHAFADPSLALGA